MRAKAVRWQCQRVQTQTTEKASGQKWLPDGKVEKSRDRNAKANRKCARHRVFDGLVQRCIALTLRARPHLTTFHVTRRALRSMLCFLRYNHAYPVACQR